MPSLAADDEKLVFGALADPVGRTILTRLEDLRVTELAERFAISRQAGFRHIQVPMRRPCKAGALRSRQPLPPRSGPMLVAWLWLNR